MGPPYPCQAEAAQPAHAQGAPWAFWEGGTVLFVFNTALGDGQSREKAPREVHPDGFISLCSL